LKHKNIKDTANFYKTIARRALSEAWETTEK